MKKASGTEETRPITVDDHRTQGNANEVRKSNVVNDVLKFPTGDEFEKDLTQILSGDYEEKGEVVVIALLDFDDFDHINKDFGRDPRTALQLYISQS